VRYVVGARGGRASEAYSLYRRNLGRAILLGLEFLVAADIIRTVARETTRTSHRDELHRGLSAQKTLLPSNTDRAAHQIIGKGEHAPRYFVVGPPRPGV